MLNPTIDGGYLVRAKAFLESSPDNPTYNRVYCQLVTHRNDAAAGDALLDSAAPILVYADQPIGVGLPSRWCSTVE